MITYKDKIKKIISEQFDPEEISLIDNTQLHRKHKSFEPDKFHFKLIIKSKKFEKMNKIEIHRAIFSSLESEIKNKIHALEIKVK